MLQANESKMIDHQLYLKTLSLWRKKIECFRNTICKIYILILQYTMIQKQQELNIYFVNTDEKLTVFISTSAIFLQQIVFKNLFDLKLTTCKEE